ncbi:MAG: ATP-binding protein [Thermomicrobiales bacterium]
MDYVTFCTVVLRKLVEATTHSSEYRAYGIPSWDLGKVVFGDTVADQPGFRSSTRHVAAMGAISTLQSLGLIEQPERLATNDFFKVSAQGRLLANDMTPLWSGICNQPLDLDQAGLVRILNTLGTREFEDHGLLECVEGSEILAHPGWEGDKYHLVAVGNELARASFVVNRSYIGGITYCPTYRSLVWQTRSQLTADSAEIDAILEEGETSLIDFKRQLAVDTASQKAELVKDVIALANARGKGTRALLIGFTDDGDFYEPSASHECEERDQLLAALTQDRLQTIIARHTHPVVPVRYGRVAYRRGQVGKLEINPDAAERPYAVAISIGDKGKGGHRVEQGQVFVRDGAVTRQARPEEIATMRSHAEQVKRRRDELI